MNCGVNGRDEVTLSSARELLRRPTANNNTVAVKHVTPSAKPRLRPLGATPALAVADGRPTPIACIVTALIDNLPLLDSGHSLTDDSVADIYIRSWSILVIGHLLRYPVVMASARGPRWQQFLQELVMVAGTVSPNALADSFYD